MFVVPVPARPGETPSVTPLKIPRYTAPGNRENRLDKKIRDGTKLMMGVGDGLDRNQKERRCRRARVENRLRP
jgi:hypothetical protein